MRRISTMCRFALFCLFISFSLPSLSQNVTGIWKGYFISEDGQHYRLEFQVKQNTSGTLSTTGVSFSWQDDIRFYGKATMTGTFISASKKLRIREIKTVELQSFTGGAAIMNYDLVYSKSGKEEFLEGTYLARIETKGRENPYEWGESGGGRVFLRKVTTTDFQLEPFLRPTPPVQKPSTNTTTVQKPPSTKPAVTNKPTANNNSKTTTAKTNTPQKPSNQPAQDKKITETKLVAKPDSVVKEITPPKLITRQPIPAPTVIKTRENALIKTLTVPSPTIFVRLYDNGEIDGDTVSVYLNNKLVLSRQMLTTKPLTISITLENENDEQELTLVAENLGRIPPNTSLMIVESGGKRFEVRITSTEQKNAVVRFRYKQPD